LANHHTVVARADEGGRGQTRAEGIGNHFMCAQRDEFDKNSLDQFAREITADVDVARILSAILTHSKHIPECPHRFHLRFAGGNRNLWGSHEDRQPLALARPDWRQRIFVSEQEAYSATQASHDGCLIVKG